jgi:hypothetical protein
MSLGVVVVLWVVAIAGDMLASDFSGSSIDFFQFVGNLFAAILDPVVFSDPDVRQDEFFAVLVGVVSATAPAQLLTRQTACFFQPQQAFFHPVDMVFGPGFEVVEHGCGGFR